MRRHRLLFSALLGLFALTLGAQDVHYTLHNYAPLWLNPANTGAFAGSVRVGGIYRGQWHSLSGIQSPTAYADAPLAFGFRKQDWVGVGFSLVSDNAGDFNIVSNFFGLSAAYHLALDKKRGNVLTIGAQYGSTSFGLKQGELIGESDLPIPIGGGGGQGPQDQLIDGDENMRIRNNYTDINAGVKLKMLLDKKTGNTFEAGLSLLHLNRGKRRTLLEQPPVDTMMPNPQPPGPSGNEDSRRRRGTMHAHARLDMELSDKWRFQPTVFFQSSAEVSSLSLQAWGSRNLKEDLDLRLGLGYRTADAAKVMVGLDAGQIRGALSYDITLSQARNVNNYQGAFELGLAYIFNIYKKPQVAPKILCPRL